MAKLGLSSEKQKWWIVNRNLLPVKLFYFFFLAGIGTLLPFITIYMKQLGLTSSETGIIYGIMPFVGFLVRPVSGAVADKLHQHKLVLMIMCFLSGVFYLCLLLVPGNTLPETNKVFTSIHCNNMDSYIRDCNNGPSCPLSLTYYGNLSFSHGNSTSSKSLDHLSCDASCNFAVPGAYSTRVCFTSTVGSFPENCLNVWISSEQDALVNFKLLDASSVIRKEIVTDRLKLKNPKCIEHRDYDLKNLSFKQDQFWRMVCDSETILNCELTCTGLDDRSCTEKTHSYTQTFWIFFVVFLLANIAFAPSLSLNDAIAYDMLGEQGKDWGKQRLWGTVGFASFAITSTLIMDALSKSKHVVNYNISFYIFGGHMLACVIVAGFLQVSPNLVCTQLFHNVTKLLKQARIVVFFLTVLIFGIYTGVIEAFLFWYLTDHINGSNIIMGLCLLLNCLAEAPFLFMSGYILNRLGPRVCFCLVFVGYAVRFFGYSFLKNPWFVLFLEPCHGVTFGLLWAAATSYTNQISPPGMSATCQGLISGIHFGFGKGLGSFLTGFMFSSLGPQWSFRVYGISAVVFLAITIVLQVTCFKDKPFEKRESVSVPHLDIKAQDIDQDEDATAGDSLLGNHSATDGEVIQASADDTNDAASRDMPEGQTSIIYNNITPQTKADGDIKL